MVYNAVCSLSTLSTLESHRTPRLRHCASEILPAKTETESNPLLAAAPSCFCRDTHTAYGSELNNNTLYLHLKRRLIPTPRCCARYHVDCLWHLCRGPREPLPFSPNLDLTLRRQNETMPPRLRCLQAPTTRLPRATMPTMLRSEYTCQKSLERD
jgi:hypothetical protein